MDFALDDEQDQIVQMVRKFSDRDLRAWAADADRNGAPPDRLVPVGTDLGFFTDAVDDPATYSHLTRALRGFELGRGCAALAALLESNVEPALATGTWGSIAAKDSLFSSLKKGGHATFWNDSRSNLEVSASGGDLRVTGKLGPVPALAGASHVLVASNGRLFLAQNLTVAAITPSGWRAARWGTANLDAHVVPAEFVLSYDPSAISTVLAWARASLAARAAGVATAAMEYAKHYASERIQFGQAIGTFESMIRLQDDARTNAIAARLFALQAAWAIDRSAGGIASPEAADLASRARVLAGDVVTRATIDAVQIYGGYGFVNDFPVEKLMRDARAFEALHGDERLGRVLAQKEQA